MKKPDIPLYKKQVESKLHVETKAMAEKKRDKFDGNGGKDALTMGGRLPMMGTASTIRAVPSWRQGM